MKGPFSGAMGGEGGVGEGKPGRRLFGRFVLLLFVLLVGWEAFAQTSGDLMHRRNSAGPQGPLIALFQKAVVATKEGDWKTIEEQVQQISGRLGEYKKNLGIDLTSKIQKAVAAKNGGEVLKYLAEVIYLDMRMQFKMIIASKMDDFLNAKERLDLAREYYDVILSGNVKRKAPNRHEKIESGFLAAQGALGNPGFYIDLPFSPPNVRGFEAASKTIETEIAAIYTYFKG